MNDINNLIIQSFSLFENDSHLDVNFEHEWCCNEKIKDLIKSNDHNSVILLYYKNIYIYDWKNSML